MAKRKKRSRGRPKLKPRGLLYGAAYIVGSAAYNTSRATGKGYEAAIGAGAEAAHCSERTLKRRLKQLARLHKGKLAGFFWEQSPQGPSLAYGRTPPPRKKYRRS